MPTLSVRHLAQIFPLTTDDTVTGVRAISTFTANIGLITEGIVGQRAVATFTANIGSVSAISAARRRMLMGVGT